jgi:hypothetical protein
MGWNIEVAFIDAKSLTSGVRCSIQCLGQVEHKDTSPMKPRKAQKAVEAIMYTVAESCWSHLGALASDE